MSCFRGFGVFRGSDLRNEGSYYLLVTEDDFARAAGAKTVMVEGARRRASLPIDRTVLALFDVRWIWCQNFPFLIWHENDATRFLCQ